ncbi:MAG: DUF4199 domain-containing protein [Bacteroidota bacterium]|nr:DUF4199 domain-containing protein [Bacteroidota bacterium]
MNPIVKQNGMKFGGIIAIISIVYYLLAYVMDESLFVTPYQWLLRIGYLVLLIIGVTQARKAMGGYISFRDAFSTYMIGALINILATFVVTSLLYYVVDPELPERIKDLSIQQAVDMAESFGAPPEQIDQIIEKSEEQAAERMGFTSQLMGVAFSIVGNAILALIIAAFFKKVPPAVIVESEPADSGEEQ